MGKARQRFPPSLNETVETLQSLFGLINKPTGAGGSNGGGVGIQRLQRNCSVSLPLGPHGLFSPPLSEPLLLSADHLFLLLDQHHKPGNSSCLQALPIRSAQDSTSKENLYPLVSHLSGDSRLPTSQMAFPLLILGEGQDEGQAIWSRQELGLKADLLEGCGKGSRDRF